MGAVFPGARTLEAFWELLATGADARVEVPAERWSAAIYQDEDAGPWAIRGKLGGFVTH